MDKTYQTDYDRNTVSIRLVDSKKVERADQVGPAFWTFNAETQAACEAIKQATGQQVLSADERNWSTYHKGTILMQFQSYGIRFATPQAMSEFITYLQCQSWCEQYP